MFEDASAISTSVEEILGIHFVVRKTFIELDEPSDSPVRRSKRAKTEPCMQAWDDADDDSETEEGSMQSTADVASSGGEPCTGELSPAGHLSRGQCEWEMVATPEWSPEANSESPNFNLCPTYVLLDSNMQAPSDVLPSNSCGVHPSASSRTQEQKLRRDAKQRPERTTLMLRNIPNDYTRDMLCELLDSQGFASRYDFMYVPIDFKRMAGLGYAFVNCTSQVAAEEMIAKIHGFRNWRFNSAKVCEVVWGEPLQGLQAHIDRYRNSPVMHGSVPDGCKPALFENGVRCPFPTPTKRIRLPRH